MGRRERRIARRERLVTKPIEKVVDLDVTAPEGLEGDELKAWISARKLTLETEALDVHGIELSRKYTLENMVKQLEDALNAGKED